MHRNQTISKTEPRFCSVAKVAEILGMSEVTVYRAIHDGAFPAVKVRGRYVIPTRALDEMESTALASGTVVDAADWGEGRSEVA